MPAARSIVRLDHALAYLDRELGRYDLSINPQLAEFEEVDDYLERLELPIPLEWRASTDREASNRRKKLVLLFGYEGDKGHPSYAIGGLSVRDVVLECVRRHQAHAGAGR